MVESSRHARAAGLAEPSPPARCRRRVEDPPKHQTALDEPLHLVYSAGSMRPPRPHLDSSLAAATSVVPPHILRLRRGPPPPASCRPLPRSGISHDLALFLELSAEDDRARAPTEPALTAEELLTPDGRLVRHVEPEVVPEVAPTTAKHMRPTAVSDALVEHQRVIRAREVNARLGRPDAPVPSVEPLTPPAPMIRRRRVFSSEARANIAAANRKKGCAPRRDRTEVLTTLACLTEQPIEVVKRQRPHRPLAEPGTVDDIQRFDREGRRYDRPIVERNLRALTAEPLAPALREEHVDSELARVREQRLRRLSGDADA